MLKHVTYHCRNFTSSRLHGPRQKTSKSARFRFEMLVAGSRFRALRIGIRQLFTLSLAELQSPTWWKPGLRWILAAPDRD